jgi:hypothetical protein
VSGFPKPYEVFKYVLLHHHFPIIYTQMLGRRAAAAAIRSVSGRYAINIIAITT